MPACLAMTAGFSCCGHSQDCRTPNGRLSVRQLHKGLAPHPDRGRAAWSAVDRQRRSTTPGHLSRQFRLAYGESPYSYLMTRRIERAMALLRRGYLSVTEVCFEVGCSSLGTFSTRFTELVGVPPSVYRRQAARATAGMPPCVAKQVTRPVRNREAPAPEPPLC